MKRLAIVGTLLLGGLLALALAGCGGGGGGSSSSGSTVTSPFDAGPRAAEGPVDEALAKQGEVLFKKKTCSTCHGFGMRITGPDLNGVTERRSAAWMEQQMLHPDVMTKSDPISHQLFGIYAVQMPNLMLKPEEAKALIEFLKYKNKQTTAAAAGH
jgi:cytochrome c551/c552